MIRMYSLLLCMTSDHLDMSPMRIPANKNGLKNEEAQDTVYLITNTADHEGLELRQGRLYSATAGLHGHWLPRCIYL